jgi:heme exporter protein A
MKLIVERLASERGGRTIFSELSFVVEKGSALCVTGPNGAGKTTLIRTLLGLIPPTRGRITLEGGDDGRTLAEQSHYVGHLDAARASLSVEENASFWCRFLGGGEDRVVGALNAFGLSELRDVQTRYLSAGQRRRLALTRLLLAPRLVWLLDEPTASLDAAGHEVLARTVNAHLEAGGLAVIAGHSELGLANTSELKLGTGAT